MLTGRRGHGMLAAGADLFKNPITKILLQRNSLLVFSCVIRILTPSSAKEILPVLAPSEGSPSVGRVHPPPGRCADSSLAPDTATSCPKFKVSGLAPFPLGSCTRAPCRATLQGVLGTHTPSSVGPWGRGDWHRRGVSAATLKHRAGCLSGRRAAHHVGKGKV